MGFPEARRADVSRVTFASGCGVQENGSFFKPVENGLYKLHCSTACSGSPNAFSALILVVVGLPFTIFETEPGTFLCFEGTLGDRPTEAFAAFLGW